MCTRARLVVLATLCPVLGCAGPEPAAGRETVYPAEGRLTVGVWPAANARLAFHPVSGGATRPVAITGPDGTYRLTTHAAADGAPAGEYVVTVLWPDDTIPGDECDCDRDPVTLDRLGGLYADPAKSPLRVTVRPEHNRLALETTMPARGWNTTRPGGVGGTPHRSAAAEAARERAGELAGRRPR